MTDHVSVEEYRKAQGDDHKLLQLVGDREAAKVRGNQQRRAKALAQELQREKEAELLRDLQDLKPEPTRGPWLLSITGLGRPPRYNTERQSTGNPANRAQVRELKRTWGHAVAEAAREAGIPPLARAFVVIQPYYPNNVVPDPDALPAMWKAVIDGLVEAVVIPNDRREELPLSFYPMAPYTDGGEPRVAVTVYPLS